MTIQEMRARKTELGLSNEQLAVLSGVPYGTVQKIISGTTHSPRRSTILALEKALQGAAGMVRLKSAPDPETSSEQLPVSSGQHGKAANPDFRYNPLPPGIDGLVGEPAPMYGSGKDTPDRHDPAPDHQPGLPSGPVSAGSAARELKKYTIYEYFNFPDDGKRCELIDGVIYDMTSPTLHHQWVLTQLGREFSNFIDDHDGACRAFVAPLDVTPDPADIYTIVQPDVMIICDRSLLEGTYCEGAPDLVVEILSPSTRRKDMTIKLSKYASAGVREYWMVDLSRECVIVYDFDHEDSVSIYGFDSDVPVGIWDGQCKINFRRIMDRL